MPALGKQRQVDPNESEASLVYKASSRTARAVTQRNPGLEKRKKEAGRDESQLLCQSGFSKGTKLAE